MLTIALTLRTSVCMVISPLHLSVWALQPMSFCYLHATSSVLLSLTSFPCLSPGIQDPRFTIIRFLLLPSHVSLYTTNELGNHMFIRLTLLQLMPYRSPSCSKLWVSSFLIAIIFHCVYLPQTLGPLRCCWLFDLFSYPAYFIECCNAHIFWK